MIDSLFIHSDMAKLMQKRDSSKETLMKKQWTKYVSKGIKSIELTLLPDYEMKIPIDVIFKLIHADENKQLIKYNFSAKQDNIYRLFVDKKSTNGEKIPSLPKAQIFKLMKSIGNTKSVCIYSKFESHEFVCQFEPNGNITFSTYL
jgi:hypothetical protein